MVRSKATNSSIPNLLWPEAQSGEPRIESL